MLDEIGEAEPRDIKKIAYSLFDGVGKIRGQKDGGNREKQQWRVLTLSTGEYELGDYLEKAGIRLEAGQAVRLPSIAVNKEHGIYNELHGFKNGAALSDHLKQATNEQHGTAAKEWIKQLQHTSTAQIQAEQAQFLAQYTSLNGQNHRVAKRFSLVYAALALSSKITGIEATHAKAAITELFNEWQEEHGEQSLEQTRIVQAAETFIQQHLKSPCIADWHSVRTDKDFKGYRLLQSTEAKYNEQGELNGISELWILPNVFKTEIAKGYNIKQACEALHKAGYLKKNSENRYPFQKKNEGRFYVLINRL